jgi:hypothetical protein
MSRDVRGAAEPCAEGVPVGRGGARQCSPGVHTRPSSDRPDGVDDASEDWNDPNVTLVPRRHLLLVAVLTAATSAAAAVGAAAYKGFDSPTQNIGCVMERGGARCDIRHHSWPTPRKPARCDLDYGGGVFVGERGRAAYICAGDTTLHAGPVLRYGRSAQTGIFRCTSEEAGMRCVNLRDGHGFQLSRQRVRLF